MKEYLEELKKQEHKIAGCCGGNKGLLTIKKEKKNKMNETLTRSQAYTLFKQTRSANTLAKGFRREKTLVSYPYFIYKKKQYKEYRARTHMLPS